MGAHSLEKLGAKMGANSFYYQRVRAERNSKNLGALNTLPTSVVNLYLNPVSHMVVVHMYTRTYLLTYKLPSSIGMAAVVFSGLDFAF